LEVDVTRLFASLFVIFLAAFSPANAQPAASGSSAIDAQTGSGVRAMGEALPEVWRFLSELDADVHAKRISSTEDLIARCRAFYTQERMKLIDGVVPGFAHMASFDSGKTLWHANVAMVALLQLDEYRAMTPAQKHVQEWIVFLHDIAKEPAGGRDHRHSFRSGAHAGRILPALGFPVTAAYVKEFEAWSALTNGTVLFDAARDSPIQDNAKLPSILGGMRSIFAEPTLTAVAVITLHQSMTSLAA
jgi:hypothetical protein